MPERIYTSAGDGKLEALEETPFPTEAELQSLIAEHPELLDGEQIRPGNARRWILVSREKGIASAGEGARWAVDHLIIDQDAVPTLAEVKRGSNPEIRRTIVGQLLEYAAHASETWTAEELRVAFDAPGRSAGRRCGSRACGRAASGWRPRCGRVLGGRLHEPRGEASASAVRGGRHSRSSGTRRFAASSRNRLAVIVFANSRAVFGHERKRQS